MTAEAMTAKDHEFSLELSRRKLLAAAGIGGGALLAPNVIGTGEAAAAPETGGASDPVTTPPVAGLHLQFGADASSEIVVSWHTLQPVRRAAGLAGPARRQARADGRGQRGELHRRQSQGKSFTPITPSLIDCRPIPLISMARCMRAPSRNSAPSAPRRGGASRFTFTSFGDQGTPTLGKRYVPPAGVTIPNPPYVNDNLGSPAAGDTTLGVERLQPLFHLLNGDLCYANLADDRVRTWWDFWENNSRSARNRPWMPAAGNHENELGNGPIGYQAYQTYFSLPPATGPDRSDAWALVCVHRRLGARDQHRQRRCRLPGRRQLLRPRIFRWRAEGLAGKGIGGRPQRSAISIGSSSACTRSRSRRPTSSTARTWASARSGSRCSTSMASISWCADTSTTMSAHTRSAGGSRTPL